MLKTAGKTLKAILPTPVTDFLRLLRRWRELPLVGSFLFARSLPTSFRQRLSLLREIYRVSLRVECPHTQREAMSYVETILSLPPDTKGVVVEAGCFKGGSTAKFSLAADLAGRKLVVFDSFQGIPENQESHGRNIFGKDARFRAGDYRGPIDEVKGNVSRYGRIDSCRFIPGWFEDTMPDFQEPIAAAYIDVDLVSSTKTCLKHLYPLLAPGGILYSQDGHLRLVIAVFDDDEFWLNEVGCKKPTMVGLGTSKLIKVVKDA